MKTQIKTSLWAVLIICLAYFGYQWYNASSEEEPLPKFKSESIKTKSEKIKESYELKIDSLLKVNKTLHDSISSFEDQLEEVKVVRTAKEDKVKKLSSTVKTEKDDIKKLEACDALVEEFDEYVQARVVEDKLNLMTIDRLKRQVTVKEDIIILQDKQLTETEALLEASIESQKQLEKALKKERRKLKRQKNKSKLAAFGAVIITSIVTSLLIKASQ